MAARLRCERCGAGLVPTVHGLRCPRFNACGRGGQQETADLIREKLHVRAASKPTASA